MKDFDFDELDKAVNSLMSDVPKSQPVSSEDGEKTLDITPTLENNQKPSFDKIAEVTGGSGAGTPAPASAAAEDVHESTPTVPPPTSETRAVAVPASRSPLPARRAGRFMDVVHPSADMKKSTPSQAVSRQGVTLEPTSSVSVPASSVATTSPVPAKTPEATEPSQLTTTSDESSTSATEKATPTNEWPDPLDMAGFKEESTGVQTSDEAPAAGSDNVDKQTTSDEPAEGTEEVKDDAPLSSPFLPNTKVEKRPLGTPTSAEASSSPAVETTSPLDNPSPSMSQEREAQLPPSALGSMEPKLPAELQGDVMAIEADTHEGLPKTEESQASPKPLPETPAKTSSVPSSPAPQEVPAPAGPTSIPQQYREEPNTGNPEHSAIYDTDTYHTPLAHPAKKKSGWLWVIWIVAILLLGAGGGAALYYLGIM